MKMEQSKRAAFVPVVITLESFEELLMLAAALGITGPKERHEAFMRQTQLHIKPACDFVAAGRANTAIGDLYNNLVDLADGSK